MKKTLLLLAATLMLGSAAVAQTETSTANTQNAKPDKAEMMASRHTKLLTQKLNLTADQQPKVKEAMLTRFKAVQAIRQKAGENADRKTMREQTKPVRQQFVSTMKGILTPEQFTTWEAHRKQMKKNREMRKDVNGNTPPASGDIKKLTDDEDGIDE